MFSKARLLETEAELYNVALRALMRRAHSFHELKKALEHRAQDQSLIKKVLDRLKHENLIDDARYATQFVRQRTEIRRQGKFRIARDLRARGVPDRHIDTALDAAAEHTDEAAMVRQRLERKLKLFRGALDHRKVASLYRSLLRAGFSADVIRRELKSLTAEDLSNTLADDAPDSSS
jgi:regulatory protein